MASHHRQHDRVLPVGRKTGPIQRNDHLRAGADDERRPVCEKGPDVEAPIAQGSRKNNSRNCCSITVAHPGRTILFPAGRSLQDVTFCDSIRLIYGIITEPQNPQWCHMRPTEFPTDTIVALLRTQTIASLPEVIAALGPGASRRTAFRRLKDQSRAGVHGTIGAVHGPHGMAACSALRGSSLTRPRSLVRRPDVVFRPDISSGSSRHHLRIRTWVTAGNHRRITAPHTRTFNHGAALVATNVASCWR